MRAAPLGPVALALSLVGCGYTLLHPGAPFGLSVIAVEPFKEEQPLGLSPDLTQELSLLLASGGVQLTSDRGRAHGILAGTILTSSTLASPTNAGSRASIPAYQVTMQVQAQLLDLSGSRIWGTTMSFFEDFLPPPGVDDPNQALATDANRRRALKRLAQRAAQQIHDELVLASALTYRGKS